jgi:tetratricopeptide (TPR) repeat protein
VTTVLGPLERAGEALAEAQSLARAAGDPARAASVLNDLGNLLSRRKEYAEAVQRYDASAALAQRANRPSLAVRALTNAATASRQTGQPETARARLDAAHHAIRAVPDSYDTAYDAIASISALIERSPGDPLLRSQRAALLDQVGLREIAEFDRRPAGPQGS